MADLTEIGRTGLRRSGGFVQEEFLRQLEGPKAAKTYREMSTNDPVIGAMLFAIEMLARQVSFDLTPASQENRDRENAEFIKGAMFEDMSFTWNDLLAEIFSMLPYGWAYFEIVYKKRMGESRDPTRNSQFNDGKIGWRKWAIRAQETLWEWDFDDTGGIQGMRQAPPPDYQQRMIPIDKALLFRTKIERNNPEGRSILRNGYRPWYFKRRIEEIEAIGIERDLAGLPILTPPENLDIWNTKDAGMVALRERMERLVRSIKRDEQEGVLKPHGWTLELLSTGGRRAIDTGSVIARYDQRIAMTTLADFILIGHEKVGSFALSSNKTHLFAVALGSFLDSITEVINRHAIPKLMRLNGRQPDRPPKLVHGDVETPDLDELGNYISRLASVGVDFTDEAINRHLRRAARLPQPAEEESEFEKLDKDGALSELIEQLHDQKLTMQDLLEEVRKTASNGGAGA